MAESDRAPDAPRPWFDAAVKECNIPTHRPTAARTSLAKETGNDRKQPRRSRSDPRCLYALLLRARQWRDLSRRRASAKSSRVKRRRCQWARIVRSQASSWLASLRRACCTSAAMMPRCQLAGDRPRDLVLHLEDIGQLAVVAVSPRAPCPASRTPHRSTMWRDSVVAVPVACSSRAIERSRRSYRANLRAGPQRCVTAAVILTQVAE